MNEHKLNLVMTNIYFTITVNIPVNAGAKQHYIHLVLNETQDQLL